MSIVLSIIYQSQVRHMRRGDTLAPCQVRKRTRQFEHPVIRLLFLNSEDFYYISIAKSLGLYCNASARCAGTMLSLPARSAIVRASFNTR